MARKTKEPDDERDRSLRQAFEERLKSGMPIRELARRAGLTNNTLGGWYAPDGPWPTIQHIRKVADAAECSAGWLAFGEGARDPAAAAKGHALAARFDADAQLRLLADVFANASQSDRKLILSVATRINPAEPESDERHLIAELTRLLNHPHSAELERALFEACGKLAQKIAPPSAQQDRPAVGRGSGERRK